MRTLLTASLLCQIEKLHFICGRLHWSCHSTGIYFLFSRNHDSKKKTLQKTGSIGFKVCCIIFCFSIEWAIYQGWNEKNADLDHRVPKFLLSIILFSRKKSFLLFFIIVVSRPEENHAELLKYKTADFPTAVKNVTWIVQMLTDLSSFTFGLYSTYIRSPKFTGVAIREFDSPFLRFPKDRNFLF